MESSNAQVQSPPPPSASQKPKRHLLLCGESLIGFAGLALAGTILSSLAFAGWVSVRQQSESAAAGRTAHLASTAGLLANSASALLGDGDISAVRRLLVSAKLDEQLTDCRIELLDGTLLADSQPSKLPAPTLPGAWPSGTEAVEASNLENNNRTVRIIEPISVPGHGDATLMLTGLREINATPIATTVSGLGVVGALGLLVSWGVYRKIRRRVRTLGLIRDALVATDPKKISRDELALAAEHGPEAVAWNRLLDENQALQQSATSERVKATLGDRREGRGDLEHACDALSVGMLVIDDTKMVKLVNGAAAVLLGSKRDEMIGKPVQELINDAAVTAALSSSTGNAPQRRVIEVQRSAESGGGTLKLHIRPLRRDDAGAALITIEDITQQRIADSARNSFVSQAAHELRTPLTNMRLCLEDALEGGETDPALIRDQFNMLNTETRRLERIVGEMLSVSEIEAGSLQIKRDDVRLEKMFEELQADFRSQAAAKQHKMTFQLPPKYPMLFGDRDKLMIVMHNLLGNALKYTPSGGTITLAARATATQLIVDITDSGIGISPDDQQKLFTKFYRAKNAQSSKIVGTGLGLALAREVARLHGGDVTLQSEVDKGSTFTLTLPLGTSVQAAA